MSLRVRTPTGEDTAISAFQDAEPPSNSKGRTRNDSKFTFRGTILLLLLTAVVGICYVASNTASAALPTVAHETNVRGRRQTLDGDTQCNIWMAPSSLKGLDGYGIFTTRDIKKGTSIFPESDGPSIPVVDSNPGRWYKTWNEYWWGRGVADHVRFLGDSVMDYQFGFGSMPNHHCILNALSHRYPEPAYHDSMVPRGDAGIGAFSYSMGRDFYVTKALKAGDEIFLNYGYCERDSKTSRGHDWTDYIPMVEDYQDAAVIAFAFLQVSDDVRVKVPKGANKFVAALLPQSTFHLREIVGSNTITSPNDLVPLIAKHVASTPRTPDWIRSNGMCLEHLVARESLLPHAGQGGFSQHFVRKGDIVVPAPMIHIVDKDSLIVYDDDDEPVGWQLLLNYCFGHPESSMLLCPDTNALLINHCSNRKKECGPNGPNVEYRWSSGWEPRSDEWRRMSLKEIGKQLGRGLSMEIVALRDIEPGEEVYMDYGPEWEEAWEKHEKNWKPPEQDIVPFITAKEANEQKELKFLVTGDLREVSDHPYLFTGCQYWPSREDNHRVYRREDPGWEQMEDKQILRQFATSAKTYRGGNYKTHGDRTYWPCSVLRGEKNGFYTVRIHQVKWSKADMAWHENEVPRLLTKYPRESIQYFVKPYASDQDLPGVFRHPIGIRDEIFPEQWKNRKQQ